MPDASQDSVTVTLPAAEAQDVIKAMQAGLAHDGDKAAVASADLVAQPITQAAPVRDDALAGISSAALTEIENIGAPQPKAPVAAAADEDRLTPQEEARVSAVMAIVVEQEKAQAAPLEPAPTAEEIAAADAEAQKPAPEPIAAGKPLISPTPGRIVWYRSRRDDGIHAREDQPLAATICGVVNDDTVNLSVHGFDGSGPHGLQNVTLVQDGECRPGQCTWMPYQRGQAAKAEQLEAKLEAKE